mmetsp:Transcript_31891/g.73267  ORF Transcript_31891/g.73267 Transcript_31891/m.73267 type:complete len:418 (-) Transcript_31891:59-1312(-)
MGGTASALTSRALGPKARKGPIAASTQRAFRSAPLKPSVLAASLSKSLSLSSCRLVSRSLLSRISRSGVAGRGMYNRLTKRRRAASSSSWGRLVAPITKTRPFVPVPSSCTKNSVLIRRLASFSSALRWVNKESISSINTTDGSRKAATEKRVRTNFSPSPIHLLVNEELEMAKNVASLSCAIAFPMSVLPVPGGPNRSRPFGPRRKPVKRSGRFMGQQTSSCTVCLASSKPAISRKVTVSPDSMISFWIFSTNSLSNPLSPSGSSSSSDSDRDGGFCVVQPPVGPFRLAPCCKRSQHRSPGTKWTIQTSWFLTSLLVPRLGTWNLRFNDSGMWVLRAGDPGLWRCTAAASWCPVSFSVSCASHDREYSNAVWNGLLSERRPSHDGWCGRRGESWEFRWVVRMEFCCGDCGCSCWGR